MFEASDTNFNIAATVKDVYTNQLVDYSPYLSFYFSLVKNANNTLTYENMGSHLCTEEDWEKFNKNIPGSTTGRNAATYEDTIKHHICLDEPEKINLMSQDANNYDFIQIVV